MGTWEKECVFPNDVNSKMRDVSWPAMTVRLRRNCRRSNLVDTNSKYSSCTVLMHCATVYNYNNIMTATGVRYML
jgi:hypothetical protein